MNILKIREVLKYFGLIYGMNPEKIQDRINFLTEILDLPCVDSVIDELRLV